MPGHEVTGYWTVESLEDPCAGWDVNISWTDVYDGVADTITFVGVVDQVDPDFPVEEGTVYLKGIRHGIAVRARAGAGCNPGIDHTPSGTVSCDFQAILSGDTISVSAFADVFTELSGISTPPFEVDAEGGTAIYGNPPPPPAHAGACTMPCRRRRRTATCARDIRTGPPRPSPTTARGP